MLRDCRAADAEVFGYRLNGAAFRPQERQNLAPGRIGENLEDVSWPRSLRDGRPGLTARAGRTIVKGSSL